MFFCPHEQAYTQTKQSKWLKWLQKVHTYIQDHVSDFADLRDGHGSELARKGGEWYGYLNPDGKVFSECKGSNYKGFFHVPRALLSASE